MKKKVLIYTDCFLYGGSERLMASLTRNRVVEAQFDVTYGYRDHKLYREGLIEEFGVAHSSHLIGVKLLSTDTLFYLNARRKQPAVVRKLIQFALLLVWFSRLDTIYNFFALRSLIKRTNPQILHINNGGYPAARSCRLMVFAARSLGVKNIVFQVNNMATTTPNKIMGYMDHLLDKRVGAFVTASIKARDTLSKNRGFALDKIVKIPNSVPQPNVTKSREALCAEFGIPAQGYIVCEIGFIERRKGQHLLIEAMELLRTNHRAIYDTTYLLLVGSGPLEQQTRELVAKELMADHIILSGYRPDPSNFLDACDLFVLPSIADEDMPLIILQAMQLQKEIVSTSFAGIQEQIESGRSGILFEPNPKELPTQLCNTIVEFRNKKTGGFGVEASKDFQSKFSEHSYGTQLTQLYNTFDR